jgi:hypothetical protein
MENLYHFWRPENKRPERGQSLVEVSLALPVLLLMLLGVFEVGWAIRGYMVLTNSNREAVRFAVKPGNLDFSKREIDQVGYHYVLTQTEFSLAEQLPLDFTTPASNATAIMSHFVIDGGFPCVEEISGNPKIPYTFDPNNCNCKNSDPDATQWFTLDDLILSPLTPGYDYYGVTYGISRTSLLGGGDLNKELNDLLLANNQLNCSLLKTLGTTDPAKQASTLVANNQFVVEMIYEQPQLLGAPLISNRFTDPVPLYTHTAMRITGSRESDTGSTIGPTCELHPISFSKQVFAGLTPDVDNPITNTLSFTVAENAVAPKQISWVVWNPARVGDNTYVAQALQSIPRPRLAIHDFVNAGDGSDRVLNIGDQIAVTANPASEPTINQLFNTLAGKTIRVPVYGATAGQVEHIAVINVTGVISTPPRRIQALLLQYDDLSCVSN